MVMQAWGNYGTAWSVVHQQLGVRPYLNDGELQVVPQVPDGPAQRGGLEHPARAAARSASSRRTRARRYTTKVDAHAHAGRASW